MTNHEGWPRPELNLDGLPRGWHHLAISAHTLALANWEMWNAPGVPVVFPAASPVDDGPTS